MKKLKLRLNPISVCFIGSLLLFGNRFTAVAILCAAIHEVGHIAAAGLLKMELYELDLGFMGARLKTSGRLHSYKSEISLCAAGPMFNFASALVCMAFFKNKGGMYEFFIVSSFFLGILNLLPIRSFDGGRIFECILSVCFSPDIARQIIDVTSFAVIFVLWSASVYILLTCAASLNLFIFSLSLFASLFIGDEQ